MPYSITTHFHSITQLYCFNYKFIPIFYSHLLSKQLLYISVSFTYDLTNLIYPTSDVYMDTVTNINYSENVQSQKHLVNVI